MASNVCAGLAGKGKVHEGRKCGALAVNGFQFCTVHLKASGYLRCECGTWNAPHSWTCYGCKSNLGKREDRS